MNFDAEKLEYADIDGQKTLSIVRTNLMNQQGYTPYCGNDSSHGLIRTKFHHGQFNCPKCGWFSQYPDEFIKRYKTKWNLKTV